MKIHSTQSQTLHIPLKFQFTQSNNSAAVSSSLLIEIIDTEGNKGQGECCPRSYVTGETIQSVKTDLQKISPLLKEVQFESMEDIQRFVVSVLPYQVGLSTICGLELALIDCWSKKQHLNLAQALNIKSNYTANYTGIIPMGDKRTQFHMLQKLSHFNFKRIKIKVNANLSRTLDLIKLIRTDFFPDVSLQVDANCSWNYQDAVKQIPVLIEQGVEVFEQLFPKEKLADLRKVTRQFGHVTKIMADESLTSYGTALNLLYHNTCNHFNLKLSKNGGFWNTYQLYQLITNNGGTCQLGAHFGETSILTAAGLLFVAKAENLTAHEGGYGDYLLQRDIIPNSVKFNKDAAISICDVFKAPGLVPSSNLVTF